MFDENGFDWVQNALKMNSVVFQRTRLEKKTLHFANQPIKRRPQISSKGEECLHMQISIYVSMYMCMRIGATHGSSWTPYKRKRKKRTMLIQSAWFACSQHDQG